MVSLPVRMLEPKNKHPVSQASDTCLPNQWLPEQIEGSQGLGLIRSLKAVLSWSLGIGTNEKEKKRTIYARPHGSIPRQCWVRNSSKTVHRVGSWGHFCEPKWAVAIFLQTDGSHHSGSAQPRTAPLSGTVDKGKLILLHIASMFKRGTQAFIKISWKWGNYVFPCAFHHSDGFFSNTTSHALRDSAWDSNPSGKSSLIPELRGKDPAAEKGSFVLTHKEGKRMWIYPIPKSLPYPYLHKECDLLTFRVITIIK